MDIEKILKDEIFVQYDPTERTEIECNEISEILEEISNILHSSYYYKIVNPRTTEFLLLLEKLGILNNRDKKLYQLKVFEDQKDGERERELNSWIYAKNLEKPTDDLMNGNEIFKWEIKSFPYCKFSFVQKEFFLK